MTTVTSVPFWVKTAVSPQKPNVMVAEWPSPGGPPPSDFAVAASELAALPLFGEVGTTAAASMNSPPLSNPAVATVLPDVLPVPTTTPETPETLAPVPLPAPAPLPSPVAAALLPLAAPETPMLIPLPVMLPDDVCCGLPTWSEQALVDTALANANVKMHLFVVRAPVSIVCIGAQRTQRLSVEWRYVTLTIASGQFAFTFARRAC